jgi:hypothetical protein
MRLDHGAAFAVGLDMELPWCPLPLAAAVRLFWHLDAIRVVLPEVAAAPLAVPPPPRRRRPERAAAGTLH